MPNKQEIPSLDAESLVPQKPFIRVHEFAADFTISVAHVINLIRSGEIVVPQELKESAPSQAAMRIPRANLVEFLKRRTNLRAVAAEARKFKWNPASKRRPATVKDGRKKGKTK